MLRFKEVQEQVRSKVIDMHRSGEGHREEATADQKEQRLVSHFPKNILMMPKTFGLIFCGLTRHKLNILGGLA